VQDAKCKSTKLVNDGYILH